MQQAIPVERLGPTGPAMAAPVEACVHCGFCLPTCPTYVELGEEMDSPRGRIFLIKEALEGKLEIESALPYIDNCLGCQACVSACPSGVEYGDLITAFRAHAEGVRERPPRERARRAALLETLADPRRFRAATRLAGVGRRLRGALPASLRALVDVAPARLPEAPAPLPAVHPAAGPRRHRVALLTGCVQEALAPEITRATLRVLARNGIETVIPAGQGCCGALAMHAGDAPRARRQARRNLAAFPADVEAVLTTAAGCGSGMREYGLLFAGEPDAAAAAALAERTLDVSTFLARVGLTAPPPDPAPLRVAYQDACHLAHAQGERDAPRALLRAIPGLELLEPAEPELCCGSAGTYNVERPEIAARLGRRKAANLAATGCELIASGNVGCLNQLRTHLTAAGTPIPALHTLEVLDRAYTSTLKEAST